MKKFVACLTAAAFLAAAASPAAAKTRRMVTVEQPSAFACIVVPFPGTACPMVERIVGSVLWIGAIGAGVGAVAAGGAFGAAAATHAVATGTAIGAGTGVVAPFVVR